jgi:fatty-acyl-CoA synthase
MNSFDWTEKWVQYQPDKVILEEFETGRSLSWRQLNNLACYRASSLTDHYNLKKGDRIALLAENSLELCVFFAAAQKAGFILVPLNYRLTGPEINYLLGNCKPQLIVYEEKFLNKVVESEAFKNCQHQLAMEPIAHEHDEIQMRNNQYSFVNAEIKADDPIFLIYTSGTTAFPKGSIYTHQMLFWNSINTQLRLDLTSNDRSLNCAPSFHTGSWNVLLTPFLHHGAYTLLMRKFDASEILKALSFYRMTIWWAVPTMLKMMADDVLFESIDLSQLRYFVVGGEAMPIPLIEQWHAKGVLIRQGYGLTEVGPNVTSLSHEDAIRKQGSIGKPNFYYQIKIADEQGSEVEVNAPGELLLKGPAVTPGYWNNEEASAESIRDGWFHTGDLVKRDAEGFLYVVDRLKNMYISGAENVYPAEVEFQIRQHPAVDTVAIIGVADEKWGEVGMAFIQLKNGYVTSSEEIIEHCKARLAKYKIPAHIRFVEELPLTDSGKIDRKQLRIITKHH